MWGLYLALGGLAFCIWFYREEDGDAYYRLKVWGLWGLGAGLFASLSCQFWFGYRAVRYFTVSTLGALSQTNTCVPRPHRNDPMRTALEQRREMLRRQESVPAPAPALTHLPYLLIVQEMMLSQRHNEFIYYDATREHSRIYIICCCPPYGKITSGRAVWSESDPRFCAGPHEGLCGLPGALCGFFLGQYCRRVETVAFDHIDDVTMMQTFTDWLRGTATIVMRVSGAKQQRHLGGEREDLVAALNMLEGPKQANQEKRLALKKALRALRHADKRGLEQEIRDAKEKIEALEDGFVSEAGDEEHQAEARKELKAEDRTMDIEMGFARESGVAVELEDLSGRDCMGNVVPSMGTSEPKPGSRTLHIPMVSRPYTVLDDLSYRCTRDNQGAAW